MGTISLVKEHGTCRYYLGNNIIYHDVQNIWTYVVHTYAKGAVPHVKYLYNIYTKGAVPRVEYVYNFLSKESTPLSVP